MHINALLLKKIPAGKPRRIEQAQAYAYGGAIIQDSWLLPIRQPLFKRPHAFTSAAAISSKALLARRQGCPRVRFSPSVRSRITLRTTTVIASAPTEPFPICYRPPEEIRRQRFVLRTTGWRHVKTDLVSTSTKSAERYAPDSYHDFIGFEVSRPVFEQAFRETYALSERVLCERKTKFSSYRHDVSSIQSHASPGTSRKTIKDDIQNATKRKFLFNLFPFKL